MDLWSLMGVLVVCAIGSVQSKTVGDKLVEESLERLRRVKRVIGGEVIKDVKDWPWLAHMDGKFCQGWWGGCSHTYCGASVVNKRWVLTAAHCFEHPDAKHANKWHIKAGEEKYEQNTWDRFWGWVRRSFGDHNAYQKIHGEKVVIHEGYNRNARWENDIALMKLAHDLPVERADIGVVTLPPSSVGKSWPTDGEVCVMKGWGCTANGGRISETARAVPLVKVSDQTCEWRWGVGYNSFTDTRLCAGQQLQAGQQGICKGDSGGPLVCKRGGVWTQAGIASFASASSPGSTPGGFTRVSKYVQWIQDKINRG